MSKEQKTPTVKDNCIGCWACVAICDEVFDYDNEKSKAFVKDVKDIQKNDCIDDAISACPVDAIVY